MRAPLFLPLGLALVLAAAAVAFLLAGPPAPAQEQPSGEVAAWALVPRTGPAPLVDLQRIDAQRMCGVAENASGAWCTADDGVTWTASVGADAGLHTLVFTDGRAGWALGAPATVLRTADGGATWQGATGPTLAGATLPGPLRWLGAFGATQAMAAGASGGIWLTADGGATWESRTPPAAELRVVRFYDPLIWYAFDATQVHATLDGGATWQAHPLPWLNQASPGTMVDARVVGQGDLAALVDAPGGFRDLWWSNDDGATWHPFYRSSERLTQVLLAERMYLGGTGYLASSVEGTNWTTLYNADGDPNEVRLRRGVDGRAFAWAAAPGGGFAGYYEPSAGALPTDTSTAPPPPALNDTAGNATLDTNGTLPTTGTDDAGLNTTQPPPPKGTPLPAALALAALAAGARLRRRRT